MDTDNQQIKPELAEGSSTVNERVQGAQKPNTSPKPCQQQHRVIQPQQQSPQPNIMQQFQQNDRVQPLIPLSSDHVQNDNLEQQQQSPAFSPSNSNNQLPDLDDNSDDEYGESVRMLICLENGEQRLITFASSEENWTVKDLLEHVEIPFNEDTNIECIAYPGNDVDYIVNVGAVNNIACPVVAA